MSSNVNRERKRQERKGNRQCRQRQAFRATVFTVSLAFFFYKECLSSLFSLSTRLLFVPYSLHSWKKNSFPVFFLFFTKLSGQHTSIIYILYNTTETGICEQTKQQLQPSSLVITCGRCSIAICSNYLSCLCKTGTYTNEKTRFIQIIIMALSSAYILPIHISIYIYIYMRITILKISRSTTRHHVMWKKVAIDRSNVRYQIYLFVD